MGMFAKAKASKSTETKSTKKKQTVWEVGNEMTEKVSKSIHELTLLSAEQKTINAKIGIHKRVVHSYAKEQFVTQYADRGIFPETPMIIQNQAGERCTFVVQDRSNSSAVKEEQVEALRALFGEDGAEELYGAETTFSLSREILSRPGVVEVLEKHLMRAVRELVKNDFVDEEEAENLLVADEQVRFKPGLIQKFAIICGSNTQKIVSLMNAMGSACVNYVKT